MFIEPFAVLLALLPLIGYLLILAVTRIMGRAIVTTGGRDIAALGIAVSGAAAVGPAELFFPNSAATVFGPWVWIALIAFYGLVLSLLALTFPPRLVVYGRTPEELFQPLMNAAKKLDPDAVAMDGLRIHLPGSGYHFRLDGFQNIDHAQVVAFESGVPLRIWNGLLANFRAEVEKMPKPSPRRGHSMLLVALGLIGILLWQGIGHHDQVVQGFRDWLWR